MKRILKNAAFLLSVIMMMECCVFMKDAQARPQFRRARESRGAAGTYPRRQEGTAQAFAAAEGLTFAWNPILSVVTFQGPDKNIIGLVGSEKILMNNEIYTLKSSLSVENGEVVVFKDFIKLYEKVYGRARKKILPEVVITPVAVPEGTIKIVLDPGHGDHNFGAVGKRGTKEKNVVLDIALELKKLLEDKGKKIYLTRSRDVFVKLGDRAQMANRYQPDIFISIHANSSKNRSASGFESFYFSGGSRESMILARLIQKEMALTAKTKNRGVKTANFYVLKKVNSPSVLIEVGFLTNPSEESRLATKSYRKQMAQAIFRGIQAYDQTFDSKRR